MRNLFLLFSCLSFFVMPQIFASDTLFQFPLTTISQPKCKFQSWSELGDDCKMALPVLTTDNYEKEKNNLLLRRIYTVLHGATYDYGWDVGYGSHLGVDISTSEGTPVYAIGDATVLIAGWLQGWGNTVVLQHTLSDGTTLWSNYAHLKEVSVTKGEKIFKGTKIGGVGNTGNSYGAHLHFQIDTGGAFHPYYYSTCSRGKDPLAVVNAGLCRDGLIANTLDPLAFLASGKETKISGALVEENKREEKIKILQTEITSRKKILEDEMKEFLNEVSFDIIIDAPGANVRVGTWNTGRIQVKYRNGRPVTGSLPLAGMQLRILDPKSAKVFPESIIALDGGKRDFQISPLKKGPIHLVFESLGQKVAEGTFYGYSPGDFTYPNTLRITAPLRATLSEFIPITGIFYSQYQSKILGMPYKGEYLLRSQKGKVKFCLDIASQKKDCPVSQLVEQRTFRYEDTDNGVLRIKAVGLETGYFELVVEREGKILGKNLRRPQVQLPVDILRIHQYYDSSIDALKKGLISSKNNYLSPDYNLLGKDLYEICERFFQRRIWQANTLERKRNILIEREKWRKEYTLDSYASVTRIQAAQMFYQVSGKKRETSKDSVGNPWKDEAGVEGKLLQYLREEQDFLWKDQFGANYFQPNKTITRGEALYLLDFSQR